AGGTGPPGRGGRGLGRRGAVVGGRRARLRRSVRRGTRRWCAVLITSRVGHTAALAVDDAMRTLSTVDWSDPRAGLLTYHPVMRGNPYQALLYSRLDDVGLRQVPAYDMASTLEIVEAVAGSIP